MLEHPYVRSTMYASRTPGDIKHLVVVTIWTHCPIPSTLCSLFVVRYYNDYHEKGNMQRPGINLFTVCCVCINMNLLLVGWLLHVSPSLLLFYVIEIFLVCILPLPGCHTGF